MLTAASSVENLKERAGRVHRDAIVVDMLQCLWSERYKYIPYSRQEADEYRAYFKSLVDSGVTFIHVTVPYIDETAGEAFTSISKFLRLTSKIDEVKIALKASDIADAKKQGKVAIVMGMQEATPFEVDLDLLYGYHKLGIRVAQLAYVRQNLLGCGSGELVDKGLTDLGHEAVEALNSARILIDVSHCGEKTVRDAIEASKGPIAITHSSAKALFPDLRRAMSDETIRALANKGGVIGQVWKRFFTGWDRHATLPQVIDIIDHLVNVAGIDHVGWGGDYTPFFKTGVLRESWQDKMGHHILPTPTWPSNETYPQGFRDIRDIGMITEELLRRGYSDEDTKKLMGGNWARLFGEVCG